VRALLATLFFSRGIPLIQQGDEMGRTQRGNNNAYAQDNDITWVDWEHADGALVDYVAALHRFRKSHKALTEDKFFSGKPFRGKKDVTWLHPEGREMSDSDWREPGGSVLGMDLNSGGDRILVWFNRRAEAARAVLPPGHWAVGMQSDDKSHVSFWPGQIVLPPRSVVALIPATVANPQPDPDEGDSEPPTPPAIPTE
jgi:glycogen operon protein